MPVPICERVVVEVSMVQAQADRCDRQQPLRDPELRQYDPHRPVGIDDLVFARDQPHLDLVRQHTRLSERDLEWLHLLVSEWQLLADLSFADLVLWLPTSDGSRYVSVAQMRPNTGPTSYQDDMVGHLVPRGRRPLLDAALDEGRIVREGDPEWREEVPVRVESIPVRREGGRYVVAEADLAAVEAYFRAYPARPYRRGAGTAGRRVASGSRSEE